MCKLVFFVNFKKIKPHSLYIYYGAVFSGPLHKSCQPHSYGPNFAMLSGLLTPKIS